MSLVLLVFGYRSKYGEENYNFDLMMVFDKRQLMSLHTFMAIPPIIIEIFQSVLHPTNLLNETLLTNAGPSALQELVCPGAEPRWSLAELIHAVVLMAHAHSLCSLVWGCGLNPEPDHIGGYTFQPPSPSHLPRSPRSPHSPAHEDGRQEVSQTFIFHHGSDRPELNNANRTRTRRYLVHSSFVSPVIPV